MKLIEFYISEIESFNDIKFLKGKKENTSYYSWCFLIMFYYIVN
ncbi:hypothetical protein THALO_10121 [Tenacibaculum halocynthiae]